MRLMLVQTFRGCAVLVVSEKIEPQAVIRGLVIRAWGRGKI